MTGPGGTGLEIAIIGVAARFPGARDVDSFWQNLLDGVESISAFSDDEIVPSRLDPIDPDDPNYVKAAGIVADADKFDAEFFGFSAREAQVLDPQQRLLLECAWDTLENAGYDSERYSGDIGVYAGAGVNSYLLNNLYASPEFLKSVSALQILLGNEKDYLASRISYKLNLRGPSVTVQTACSSSLVAVHLACQSLLNAECDLALAGGVALTVPQTAGYLYQEGGISSPDGHCRAFDAEARGTVKGNGVGMVALRRLEDALADGDSILAVIKGSAVNNDGSQKLGYTAPSPEAQAKVIRAAQLIAGVDPRSIGYLEAHGTATALGDPIEIAALSQAFGAHTAETGFCAIGSVKTNIGHLDAASGIAGLIKAALVVNHGVIPASLHYRRPNPQIAFDTSPFYVNTALSEWPETDGPRRAGVSSFGIGGTNAHVILEQPPPVPRSLPASSAELLLISARTPAALDAATGRLAAHLRARPELALADVAYTTQHGRRPLAVRRAVVCRTTADAVAALEAADRSGTGRVSTATGRVSTVPRRTAFLFPGQGSQHPRMAVEVYDNDAGFRAEVDRCCQLLEPRLGIDLRTVLYPGPGKDQAGELDDTMLDGTMLDDTMLAQPALFVVEYALARLWLAAGVAPEAMIGHSIGEYVAACLAGVFELEAALTLVAERGRLMQQLPAGRMIAVPLPADQLAELLGWDLELAAVNRPDLCVLSGTAAAVAEAEQRLAARGVGCSRLRTSHAFHSRMVEPILAEFEALVAQAGPRPPSVRCLSNVTGSWLTDAEATDPSYWAGHLRRPVRFADGISTLLSQGHWDLLEVGPGQTLATAVRRSLKPEDAAYSSLDPSQGMAHLLAVAGRLWVSGTGIEWAKLTGHQGRRRVPLPCYPFERRRYWVDADGAAPLADPAGDDTATPERPVQAPAAPRTERERTIAALWQEALCVPQVGIHDNFLALGGDSIIGLQVTFRARQLGLDITTSQLLQHPTVAELAVVAGEVAGSGDAEAAPQLPGMVAAPAERYEPFPLTEMQQAYWIGRSALAESGNVASHVYQELAGDGLDVARLEDALNEMIDRHEALRAVTTVDGRQRVLEKVPRYVIEVHDLRGRPSAEVDAEILTLRARMSHQILPTERWPLFELRAVLSDGGRVRLHASIDILFTDAWSLVLAGRELAERYFDPDREYPPLEATFRDYVLAERRLHDSPLYARARRYWLSRLDSLPAAPRLPLAGRPDAAGDGHYTRRLARLDPQRWQRLTARASRAGLTPSMVLCAVYAEVLAARSDSPRFCLNLPLYNRLPLHPQVAELLGDFTSVVLLEVDCGREPTFEGRAHRIQAQLWDDLDHRHFSGVQVMRELAHAERPSSTMPIVFTSLLFPEAQATDPYAATPAGSEIFGVSQTPQVLLDEQVFESDGCLVISWDAQEDAFAEGVIAEMFQAHHDLLVRLADDEDAWSAATASLLPAATWPGPSSDPASSAVEQPGVPVSAGPVAASRPPATPTEQRLLAIWRELLDDPEIGLQHDLFALGGDSITATRLVLEIRAGFEVDLPLRTVFERPTVAGLAQAIDEAAPSKPATPLTRLARHAASRGDPLPASAAQHRLWYQAQLEPGSTTYNYQEAVRITGPLDPTALRQSLVEVARRHEILRTSFADLDGVPVQVVADSPSVELRLEDLSTLPSAEAEVRGIIEAEARHPFDLATGPLLRTRLLRLADDQYVLVLTMHHIVCDAWSIALLISEVAALYEAFTQQLPSPLPELPIQYADYAAWEHATEFDPDVQRQLAYWQDKLRGFRPGLRLPEDHPGAAPQPANGARHAFTVSPALSAGVRAFCRREQVTLFVALMTAWQAVLHYYSGQHDILVGSPTANRSQPETRQLIGFFVNTLAIRTSLAGDPTFTELAHRVRATALEAFSNERVPFDRLVEEFWREHPGMDRAPLFRTWFVLQNVPMPPLRLGELVLAPMAANTLLAVHDLKLIVVDQPESLSCALDYRTHLFEPTTIRRMASLYQALLWQVVASPDARLSELMRTLAGAEQLIGDSELSELRPRGARRQAIHVAAD